MTLTFDRVQALAYLTAIGVPVGAVVDWRAIHDTDKTIPAIPFRDTLDGAAASLERYNNAGYGLFVVVNELDGSGRDLSSVSAIRAHMIDYDQPDASWQTYQAVAKWELPPTFTVTASIPGKFHAYWSVHRETGAVNLAAYELTQRKLAAKWNSDPSIVDATRVMRLPGSWHLKNPVAPAMVTMYAGSGLTYASGALEWALQLCKPGRVAVIARR
jgi:hypothetical protein